MRVKEDEKAKGRSVTEQIGIAESSKIIPRESGQTSVWSFNTRELGKLPQEEKQMTVVETQAGASPTQ